MLQWKLIPSLLTNFFCTRNIRLVLNGLLLGTTLVNLYKGLLQLDLGEKRFKQVRLLELSHCQQHDVLKFSGSHEACTLRQRSLLRIFWLWHVSEPILNPIEVDNTHTENDPVEKIKNILDGSFVYFTDVNTGLLLVQSVKAGSQWGVNFDLLEPPLSWKNVPLLQNQLGGSTVLLGLA